MANEGSVSTEDTPIDRPMNVITSETDPKDEKTSAASSSSDDQSTGKSANSDDNSDTGGKKRNRKTKRRIDKLTKDNTQLSDSNANLEAKLEAALSENAELRQTTQTHTKPKRDQFDDDEAFAEAYSDWKAAGTTTPKKAESKPKAKPAPAENPHAELVQEITDSGSDRYDDWDEIWVNAPLNQHMAEALFEEDDPDLIADVVFYLHENMDDSVKLFKESTGKPRTAAKRMDEIIEKVKASQGGGGKGGDKQPATPAKKEPPEPANHMSTGSDTTISDSTINGNESMDDYATKRLAQEKLKRRH